MISIAALTALLVSLVTVKAQSPVYGQCGGIGWSGATTCAAGSTCTVSNAYYSQCLPGSSAPSSTTAKPTTTAPATTTAKPPTTTGSSKVNYWFVFGDSYTTTGFNITTGPLPSNANPLGNPGYPGFTGGGGANYVDYVTLSYNKSLLYTYNFAYGGATIDATLVTPYLPTVLSLTDQVNAYLNTIASHPSTTPWTAANTLFSVWIGINDVGNSYGNGGGSAFNTKLMNAYFALVQKLYNSGARNFLFINVPPIDRSPLMLAQSTSSQALEKTIIADFNSQLAAAISKFKSSNSGVTTWSWDSNAAFTTILNSPTTYGFVDATSYSNTGDFWGNNYHPGAAAHQIFGQQIGNTVLSGTVW